MKFIKYLSAFVFLVFLVGGFSFFSVTSSQASSGKGTLFGNAAGTKFCCGSGTNDCGATPCKPAE
jgi:hypothetical protein